MVLGAALGGHACLNELHLGRPDVTLGGGGAGGDDGAAQGGASGFGGQTPCALAPSGPLTTEREGQVIENLRIVAEGEPAVVVQHSGVVLRNLEVRHQGGPGILIEGADDVSLEDVSIENDGAPESGPLENDGGSNVTCQGSARLRVHRARVARGSSGFYLEDCPSAHLSEVFGEDLRGPFPRGQFVRFQRSAEGLLEDFAAVNGATSWPGNIVHVSESANVVVRRGLIDGNNWPQGHGVLFSGPGAVGLVEDVDAIRMGNGCFSSYSGEDGSVFRRTRCRENICSDQGRGAPTSGGILWSADENHTAVRVEDSTYFAACNAGLVWPESAFATLELTEADFPLRSAPELTFCWEAD